VRLSHLEHRVCNTETAFTQLQSAWSFQQANFGGPSLWPGFGISPGAGPAPGFGYQLQYICHPQDSTHNLQLTGLSLVTIVLPHWKHLNSQHPVAASSHRLALLPVSSSDDRIYLPPMAIDKTSLWDVAEVVEEHSEWKNT